MSAQSTSKRLVLQRALDSRNWKDVDRVLSSVPSQLPKNCDPTTITASLEEVRAAADALVQACDFGTSFESSFATRKALIRTPSVLSWTTQSLSGFSFEERLIGRIAAVLGLLGMGSEGRVAVGCAGAVDQLTVVWSSHPTSVDIVRALVSLCSSHIDNVSRTMRRRGISIAVEVLSDDTNREDISLIEQTLLYIGLCAICTPDTAREEHSVVPALLKVLEDDLNLRRPQLLRHVLMALGNIMDCWTKEGFGYHLGDANRLVDAVLKAWGSLRRSKDIAKSSSWALGSMLVGEGPQRAALQCRLEQVKALAEPWKAEFKTCAFLYEAAHRAAIEPGAQLNERKDQMTKVDKSDDHSKVAGSSPDPCVNHVVKKRLSIAKRKWGTRNPHCEVLAEDKAETATDQTSSVRRSNLEKESERDLTTSTSPIRSVPCDDVPSTPDADPCGRGREPKKARKNLGNLANKVNLNSTPIRRSKRCRPRFVKPLQVDSGRNSRSSRYAKRIPIEVIEISSDSDDERGSPKAVQDICT